MTNRVEAARMQVLAITGDFVATKFRLLGVHAYLSPDDAELDRLGNGDATDPATLLHTAIACVLLDHLEPMIRDLEAAVAAASSEVQGPQRDRLTPEAGTAADSQGQDEA